MRPCSTGLREGSAFWPASLQCSAHRCADPYTDTCDEEEEASDGETKNRRPIVLLRLGLRPSVKKPDRWNQTQQDDETSLNVRGHRENQWDDERRSFNHEQAHSGTLWQPRGRIDGPRAANAGREPSPLPDSTGRPPPYHRVLRRDAGATAGSPGHRNHATEPSHLRTSDRGWTRAVALLFPRCSLVTPRRPGDRRARMSTPVSGTRT